jgi:HEAT repeat protein
VAGVELRVTILAALVTVALPAVADDLTVLDTNDRAAIAAGLHSIRMTESDLSFKKDHAPTVQTTELARQFLHDPLQLAERAESVARKLKTETSAGALAAQTMDKVKYEPTYTLGHGYSMDWSFLNQMPESVRHPVRLIGDFAINIEYALGQTFADNRIQAFAAFAVENLNLDKDASELTEWEKLGLPVLAVRELLDRSDKLELQDDELAAPILEAGKQLKWGILHRAFESLAGAVDEAVTELKTNQFTEPYHAEVDTKLGKIIVNNLSHTVFTNEAFLIIDTGHDNVYLNSAGGANGLAGRPISIVISLGNNNQFVSRQSFSQGSGVFGIGILAALGSNSTFAAKHVSQGAGFFGCGLLMTGEGRQIFEADTFCQGASAYGAGILWQRGGDTTYQARQMAQGFGGPGGCGLLLDSGGNDVYFAGGKYSCDWLPGHYFSLAQGFGYGMRPFAGGGVGILCDVKGDDRYVADVYGQGASYWYSVGLFLDLTGNDTYQAHQYCQGAGIHLSSGALVDFAGDDQYTAHAICQGGAHDYAVGLLVDRAGNDTYTAGTTAQGSAINTSFAMLLDHAGNDFYAGRDPTQSQAAGHDGGKRECGAIALLLDLAGTDTYSQGQTNNTVWLKPWYGAGLDAEWTNVFVGQAPRLPLTETAAGESPALQYRPVDVHHPTERLLRLAISEKPDAGKAWSELKHLGTQALSYLLSRLDSPNVLLKAKVEELVDHLGTNSIPVLMAGIDNAANDEVVRLCCYFLARFDTKARAAIPHVLPLLDREKVRGTAFYTLGHLRAQEATGAALKSLTDDREVVRMRAAQALGRIGDRQAVPALIGRLDDELWTVRYAAQDALIALGQPSRGPLRAALATASPRARPHLIAALEKLNTRRGLFW